ncbi:TspO and MBR related proteins [Anaerosporobacter mobilis DSM 15930]|jgi:tryptophan-rich sensory protein|uniref:TspO and MBR related proteins n=1 Tax=Anaerosporobacter mobilis DSM 15930 TaxID=1120996 RepID=A0A1M7LEY3_9FIRM|nr:TspO and MBR related proteins [Anaerosporobacter mobilis DSM 15930]
MNFKCRLFIISLLIPLLIGGISGFITRNSMETFALLNKPPLSPPGWLFPIVWTTLYILMGVASYIVLVSNAPIESKSIALKVYLFQLVINFFWSLIFFNLEQYLLAFFWLLFLWVLIIITIILFYNISKTAAYLLIPYLLWVTFAGYLNLSIYLLN